MSIRTCPDGHRCENGSSCAEHPNDEGKYYCDCGTSNGDFAGLFCEYEAEAYCQMENEVTSNWFCTNQGTCVLSVAKPEAQWNCDCPADFDGPVRHECCFKNSAWSDSKHEIPFAHIPISLMKIYFPRLNFLSLIALSIRCRQCSAKLAGVRF